MVEGFRTKVSKLDPIMKIFQKWSQKLVFKDDFKSVLILHVTACITTSSHVIWNIVWRLWPKSCILDPNVCFQCCETTLWPRSHVLHEKSWTYMQPEIEFVDMQKYIQASTWRRSCTTSSPSPASWSWWGSSSGSSSSSPRNIHPQHWLPMFSSSSCFRPSFLMQDTSCPIGKLFGRLSFYYELNIAKHGLRYI